MSKVESVVEEEMLYLLIKDNGNKVRTYNTMRTVPDIPLGCYTLKREGERIMINKIAGKSAKEVKTVKVNGMSYIAKTEKNGQLVLTPAPEIRTFELGKNKADKVDLRSVCASVRLFVAEREDKGIFGVFNEGGQLLVERLR